MKRILIFGGTGFIGRELISKLKEDGNYLILASRKIKPNSAIRFGVNEIFEFKEDLKYFDSRYLENIDVIINLAGESIMGLRWTSEKKKRIYNSRKKVIKLIEASLEKFNFKIPLLIQASAVGIYGYSDSNKAVTEKSCVGEGFLAEVCKKLEIEVTSLNKYFDRVSIIRLGVVLGHGGFIDKITKGFIFNMGFSIGSGDNWFSWIHIDDVINGIKLIMNNENMNGPINFVTKESIRFSELIKALRVIKNNRIMVTIPSVISRFVLGDMGDMLIKGIKVRPEILIKNEYEYKFSDIELALENILTNEPKFIK